MWTFKLLIEALSTSSALLGVPGAFAIVLSAILVGFIFALSLSVSSPSTVLLRGRVQTGVARLHVVVASR
jgi:hypothetical protein